MKALRSLESTSAPHLIILSTSLDQALLAQTLLQNDVRIVALRAGGANLGLNRAGWQLGGLGQQR